MSLMNGVHFVLDVDVVNKDFSFVVGVTYLEVDKLVALQWHFQCRQPGKI